MSEETKLLRNRCEGWGDGNQVSRTRDRKVSRLPKKRPENIPGILSLDYKPEVEGFEV